jgi:N-acetylmuramoyl-L-alanine amidase
MPEITYAHIGKRINSPMTAIKPIGIVLHYIGNPGTTAAQNARYFANVQSKVSVHYIVDDAEIIEIIPPDKKSYGTSSGAHNESYIQIEMCHPDTSGKITDATLNNTIWLCRQLIREYGITKIIRHYDVTGKRCPMWYVNNPHEWDALVKRIVEGGDRAMGLDEAIAELVKRGIINSPEYWVKACDVVKHLDELLIKVAKGA